MGTRALELDEVVEGWINRARSLMPGSVSASDRLDFIIQIARTTKRGEGTCLMCKSPISMSTSSFWKVVETVPGSGTQDATVCSGECLMEFGKERVGMGKKAVSDE